MIGSGTSKDAWALKLDANSGRGDFLVAAHISSKPLRSIVLQYTRGGFPLGRFAMKRMFVLFLLSLTVSAVLSAQPKAPAEPTPAAAKKHHRHHRHQGSHAHAHQGRRQAAQSTQ